jgi:peroxiredoxin
MTASTQTLTLQEQIDVLLRASANSGDSPSRQLISDSIANLAASGIVEQSLQAGDLAPDFTLPNATGGTLTLSELLTHGPVVLTFYRGEWCPFCNLTLRAYESSLPDFALYGATLVAVSPQTPDYSLLTVKNKQLTYPVLSDVGNRIAREYRLVYRLQEPVKQLYRTRGLDLSKFNGDESWELPLTGTFVIGPDCRIALAFVDASFMKRLEPAAIVEALGGLSR